MLKLRINEWEIAGRTEEHRDSEWLVGRPAGWPVGRSGAWNRPSSNGLLVAILER